MCVFFSIVFILIPQKKVVCKSNTFVCIVVYRLIKFVLFIAHTQICRFIVMIYICFSGFWFALPLLPHPFCNFCKNKNDHLDVQLLWLPGLKIKYLSISVSVCQKTWSQWYSVASNSKGQWEIDPNILDRSKLSQMLLSNYFVCVTVSGF